MWTRGKGCSHVADLVSGGTATRVEGDLKSACIANGTNVVVTAKAHSFDLASTIVPHSINDATSAPTVVGAVGTGPHSPLVAQTTGRLADAYGGRSIVVTMARQQHEEAPARRVLDQLAPLAPGADLRLVHADTAAELVASLPGDTLLVLGAPGGSWWQRQFFGPGRRLIHAAPAGSIVVRAAARRCFHDLSPLAPMGAPMLARDAFAVMDEAAAPVVDGGKVIGCIRRSAVTDAAPGATVGDIMEDPVTVAADELVSSATNLASHLEGAPIPVVDDDGKLLGGLVV